MRVARTSRLGQLIEAYKTAAFSYDELGATRGELPPGYHHTRFRSEVGRGEEAFREAGAVVMAWDMQRGAGMRAAVDGPAEEGRTVVLALGHPLGLVAPCRVVYVVDEPTRRGFGYGTLPGHPECGEEAFVVTIDEDGIVRLEITAFSRPGSTLVKIAGPLNGWVQQLALRAYARSVRRQLRGTGSTATGDRRGR